MNWSRSTLEFAAPFSTILVFAVVALALWRFASGDAQGGVVLLLIALVDGICAGLGWHFRRTAPEDPWEPH